jgi:hypothetical protein
VRNKDFEKVVREQQNLCLDLLVVKGKEYSTSYDKLHNFKTAATLRHCSVKQALAGMMAKHTVSIYDMCESDEEFSLEKWDEKLTDHLNYLLLLKAIVVEEKNTSL